MLEKVKGAAVVLNPVDRVGRISPGPLLIIHWERDTMAPVDYAYEVERYAGQPKELVIAVGRMHSDAFFFSGDRDDMAIGLTLDWLERNP